MSQEVSQEIINIINSESTSTVKAVQFLGLLTSHYYSAKPAIFFSHVSWLLKSAFYQTLILDNKSLNCLVKNHPDYQIVNGIPLYIEKSDYFIIIHYHSLIHYCYINKLKRLIINNSPGTQYCIWRENSYITQSYQFLFPAKDYLKIMEILESYIAKNITCNPLLLCLTGIPGAGLSSLPIYLASTNILTDIYKIDLAKNYKLEPAELFRLTFLKLIIRGPTLLFFDNLDKYLYFNYQNQSAVPDWLEYKKFASKKLLQLINQTFTEQDQPLIVIFCGTLLTDEFLTYELSYCDREEVCNYLRFYNNKYLQTKYYEPDLERHLTRLPALTISFRELTNLGIQNSNNMIQIIEALIVYTPPKPILLENIINLPINKEREIKIEEIENNKIEDNYEIMMNSTKCFKPTCPNRINELRNIYYCDEHRPLYQCVICYSPSDESKRCYLCFGSGFNHRCAACHKFYDYAGYYDGDPYLCSNCDKTQVACRDCGQVVAEEDVKFRWDKPHKPIKYCLDHLLTCAKCNNYCPAEKYKREQGGVVCFKCFDYTKFCYSCRLIKEGIITNNFCESCAANITPNICQTCAEEIDEEKIDYETVYYEGYCHKCQPDRVCHNCLLAGDLNQYGLCFNCDKCSQCSQLLELNSVNMKYNCRQCNDFICHKPECAMHNNHIKNINYLVLQGDRVCSLCQTPECIITNGDIYRLTCTYCYTITIDNKICSCLQCTNVNINVSFNHNMDVAICCHACGQRKLNELELIVSRPLISLSDEQINILIDKLRTTFYDMGVSDEYFTPLSDDPNHYVNYFTIEIYQLINNNDMIYAMLRSAYGLDKLKCINDIFEIYYPCRRKLLIIRRIIIAEIFTKINLLK